jgi:hypothetical protein
MNITKKVEDSRISEQTYRGLKDRLSYSSIKKFDSDRQAFYKEMVLGEVKEEKISSSIIMGHLVHTLLSGMDFDEKFHIAVSAEPKGQMADLVNNLYNRTLKSIDKETGMQTDSFETIFMDAVTATKYDYNMQEVAFKGKDAAKILSMFTGDAEIYYKEKLLAIGKMVVSVPVVQQAERLVEKIKAHPHSQYYANVKTDTGVEVFHELPILFDIDEVPYKAMVDKVIVDHIDKTIAPIDWKTSWDNENPQQSYTKFGYYLQAAMYNYALTVWAKEHGLEGYQILPMKFIFIDTAGFADPVVLVLSSNDLREARDGFHLRGYKYSGLTELIKQITWHVETGIWSSAMAIAQNNGEVTLDLNYE